MPLEQLQTWIIEPLDGLIVGDGRSFDLVPGARAYTRSFPPPSVTAGGIRTRNGLLEKLPDARQRFDSSHVQALLDLHIQGPLLVELTDDGAIKRWLAPAPADAQLLQSNHQPSIITAPLRPHPLPPGTLSATIPTLNNQELNLLFLDQRYESDAYQALKSPPAFWDWEHFTRWLLDPTPVAYASTSALGLPGLDQDLRTHVRIDPASLAAMDSYLFQTSQLLFRIRDHANGGLHQLALAVRTDAANLDDGLAALGGERRLMRWWRASTPFPTVPAGLAQQIAQDRRCRLVLLSPAIWQAGFVPAALAWSGSIQAHVRAVACRQPLVLSGWDLQANKPKPSRRLAPAGTVVFVELEGATSAIEQWVDAMWMRCISDAEQDCRDGFGLAVLGAWPTQEVY